MGKTKIATIDDSAEAEENKKKPKKVEAKKTKAENIILNADKESDVIASEAKQSEEQQDKLIDKIAASPSAPHNDKGKKAQKPGKRTKVRSKKYKEALEKVDRNKNYPILEAVNLAKESSYSKYPGSLEIHINTNIKNLRGLVSLPFASGKKLTILAFGKNADESGADIVGDDETIEQIAKGKINFDVLITTPEWMPKLAKVAKFLGPRGLMPSPKNGTITDNLKKAVLEIQSGKTEYKSEKNNPVIHLGIGKIDQPENELSANVKVLLSTIGKSKLKKVTLAPTLGPGVKVDLGSI